MLSLQQRFSEKAPRDASSDVRVPVGLPPPLCKHQLEAAQGHLVRIPSLEGQVEKVRPKVGAFLNSDTLHNQTRIHRKNYNRESRRQETIDAEQGLRATTGTTCKS